MSETSSLKYWAPGVVALAVLLSTCEGPLSRPPAAITVAEDPNETVTQRLQGTWVREESARGLKAARTLVLRADGRFEESVRITDETGKVTEHLHEGTWLYDGTNLKRRYTLMNGQPPSRLNLPFATFQVAFDSRNEFTGVDHIHGNKVHYRRAAAP